MLRKIFSIRDAKAEAYMTPFYAVAFGEAERTFDQLRKDQNTTISKYPEDFDLYYLGQFDDLTGKMDLLDTPQHVRKAAEISV